MKEEIKLIVNSWSIEADTLFKPAEEKREA